MMSRYSTVLAFLMLSAGQTALAKTQTVSVCLPAFREELTTLAVLAAEDLGSFSRQGIKIDIKLKGPLEREPYSIKQSTPDLGMSDLKVSQNVAKGHCDFGTSVVDTMIVAPTDILEATEPVLVSSYNKDYDTHLVVAKNSPIKTLKDLKGKRIRMGQIPNGMALDGLLKKEGLSLKDVEQVHFVPVTQVLAMLENGKLDAAITYVPTMPYMLASGKVRVLSQNLLGNLTGEPLPHSLIVVNKKFRTKNPELFKSFMTALDEAQKHFARNPSQIAATLSKHSKFLRAGEWKLDPVVTERSGAYIGKINLADLTKDEPARLQVANGVRAYTGKLKAAKYFEHTNDLSRWFGANVQAAL